jgi:hypothetical protein
VVPDNIQRRLTFGKQKKKRKKEKKKVEEGIQDSHVKASLATLCHVIFSVNNI